MSTPLPVHIDSLYRSRPALGPYFERLLSGPPPASEASSWGDVCIILASGPTAKRMDNLGHKGGWYTPPWAPDLRVSTAPRWKACKHWRAEGMVSLARDAEWRPTATPVVYYFGPGPKFMCSVMWVELEGGAA